MVLPRILTAAVLVPLVLAIVWFGSLPFYLFVLAVCLLSAWEFALMAKRGGYPNQIVVGILGTVLLLGTLILDGGGWGPLARTPGPVFVFALVAFASFVREFFRPDKSYSLLNVITTLAGVALCGLFLGHLVLVRDLRVAAGDGYRMIGRELTFFLLVVVWTVDTGAWCVGRLIGRRPMAPVISPKKTWEGAIGGTALALLAGWLFREAFLADHLGRSEAVAFAFLIALSAQASDLIESLIKRSFGVKNSSELLPGHGGVLDRFDSLIFASPLFFYALTGTGRFI